LFDAMSGYPKGHRALYGHFSTVERIALTLGLPQGLGKVGLVRAYQEKMAHLKPVPPVWVERGAILENVQTGNDIDVLKFPVPRHHERDCGRYIATASAVITRDPDEGWFNVGTYRSKVYDGRLWLPDHRGKHGRIHRDKYFERGEAMKVAIVVGQDPPCISWEPVRSRGVSEFSCRAIEGSLSRW
jgi:UbiD family decarboxylase